MYIWKFKKNAACWALALFQKRTNHNTFIHKSCTVPTIMWTKSVTVVADATVYVWFLARYMCDMIQYTYMCVTKPDIYRCIHCSSDRLSFFSFLFFFSFFLFFFFFSFFQFSMRRFRLFLAQCCTVLTTEQHSMG